MKFLLTVLILIGILLGVKELYSYWQQVHAKHAAEEATRLGEPAAPEPAAPAVSAPALNSLPPQLEASLDAARRQGADGLRVWLQKNRRFVPDPRLADIELDYVLFVAGKNFGEARDVFQAVKARTPTNSPVYPRIRQLERTYQ